MTAEGTTFRDIANRVRYERACDLRREGSLSVVDIGTHLGYAGTPSFVRAFKAMGASRPGQFAG